MLLMEIINAVILGFVQGLTEFLPVSSSGHLVVVGRIINLNPPGVLFEALLHAGTAAAIIWYMRHKLLSITSKELGYIFLASVPAGIVGIFFSNQIESLFSILKLVGIAFLITAFFNFQTDKYTGKRENLDVLDALFIGVMQAFAILPGISRAGATIFAGTKMNLSKTRSAEFSFLISIPAIIGANIVEFYRHGELAGFGFEMGLAGFIAAFLSGLFAINFLMRMLSARRLKYFSYYLLVVGVLTLLFL